MRDETRYSFMINQHKLHFVCMEKLYVVSERQTILNLNKSDLYQPATEMFALTNLSHGDLAILKK